MGKKCSKCKVVKSKSEFSRDKSKKDGLYSSCKECKEKHRKNYYENNKVLLNTKAREYYSKNKQREIDQSRKWHRNNTEKAKATDKRYYEKNKEKLLTNYRKYHKKHPEREIARNTVRYAVKTGKIQKPDRCINCNVINPLDGHHEDYDKPLEVQWLCRSCHKQLHFPMVHLP